MSLLTCVGDLEASKTLLCGLQYSNSNSLQDMEGDLDKGQKRICVSSFAIWL